MSTGDATASNKVEDNDDQILLEEIKTSDDEQDLSLSESKV
jgi:hypothetical protein